MNILSMQTRPGVATLAVAAALMFVRPVLAEDIDIYAGSNGTSDLPNVLLILDSSANWSTNISGAANCYYKNNGVQISPAVGPVDQGTKLGIEQCALYNLVDGLPVKTTGGPDNDANFKVAVMLMNESPKDGTYPRHHFIALTSNNKAALKSKIASFHKNNDKANNADYGLAMYEAYLYYKGATRLNGGFGPNGKRDDLAFTGTKYNSPSGGSCGSNYVIVIGNGSPQNSSPEKSVENLLAALPANSKGAPNTTQIAVPLAGNDQSNWSDEMSRYMRYVDVSGKADAQGIITHAIAVKKGPSDGGFPYLMNSIASQGGGSYFEATSADQLTIALVNIFNQIQAVNSVFSSASLPVSVNLQGSFLNQIFLGMFRPDANAKPRWFGNMKQFRFGLDNLDNLFLADAAGNAAVSAATGFINPSAVSYWTTTSTFWANRPSGTPSSGSDSPDGEIVEKGGAGQRLRIANATSQASRKVLTCVGCAGGTLLAASGGTAFENLNTAITQTALVGTTSEAERTDLINWMRGTDNKALDAELGPGGTTTVRPSIHGDVLHSRPAVVNYGGTNGVVVFYGGNDGMLHAVKGNTSSTDGGDELWSFVPQEMFGKLNRLRSNTPAIRLSTTPAEAVATPRDYFVDGPIGVYRSVNASNVTTKAILYVTMRRGGRVLYAIDVTDPTAPQYLWKVSNATTGMTALGQTWSAPKVARVKGQTNPVVIFGGGYDAVAEDANSAGSTTMGNAVFVLDAFSGALLRSFTTLDSTTTTTSIGRSVAADVSLIDSDFDKLVDRAYAVDLGGQVYRIDFEDSAGASMLPAAWTIYKLADLSGGTSTGRKFFFAPDVVTTGTFAALSFGSGDREKPLLSATVDHFFQVLDYRMGKGAPAAASHTPIAWPDLIPSSETGSTPTAGCYVALDQGEKVVNAAASIGGNAFFGTNRPAPLPANTCSANLGLAKAYSMPLFCATPTSSIITGGGLPPSPVVGIVEVAYTKPDGTQGTKLKPFVIGAPNPKQSGLEVSEPVPPDEAPRKRRYWYPEVSR
ncbi:MAG: PilC/PilY family type IV pilus protein [Burkholderiaceae bacterium]